MLYKSDNVQLMARRVAKFHGVIPLDPKVIGVNTLHFKPILTPPLQKIVRGTLVSLGGWLVRLGYSMARVKVSGHSVHYGPTYGLSKK